MRKRVLSAVMAAVLAVSMTITAVAAGGGAAGGAISVTVDDWPTIRDADRESIRKKLAADPELNICGAIFGKDDRGNYGKYLYQGVLDDVIMEYLNLDDTVGETPYSDSDVPRHEWWINTGFWDANCLNSSKDWWEVDNWYEEEGEASPRQVGAVLMMLLGFYTKVDLIKAGAMEEEINSILIKDLGWAEEDIGMTISEALAIFNSYKGDFSKVRSALQTSITTPAIEIFGFDKELYEYAPIVTEVLGLAPEVGSAPVFMTTELEIWSGNAFGSNLFDLKKQEQDWDGCDKDLKIGFVIAYKLGFYTKEDLKDYGATEQEINDILRNDLLLDTIPDTYEKVDAAIKGLSGDVVTHETAEEFDAEVSKILTGMEKLSDADKAKAASALGAKLKTALNINVTCMNNVEVEDDAALIVALGLTGSADKGKKVTVGLKDGVATSSDASKPGSFTVEIRVDNNPVSVDKLKTPITVTVQLPADLIATMSDASRTYELVLGGTKIPYDIDKEKNTITFTTDKLGAFDIVEKKKPTGQGSHGGGYSSSGSSTRAKRNASGNWIQDEHGWWFKYTSGGYPAGKWEMIKDKWYYFNSDGYMATGWQLIGNVWYHLDDVNGDMATGWYLDAADGKWYYLNGSGAMLTGWQLVAGKYYYLAETTEAPTYTYDENTKKWVYTNTKARPYGSMYANETTPDGYTVDASGAWIQ